MAKRKIKKRSTPLESYGSVQDRRPYHRFPEAPAHKRKSRKSDHNPYGKRN